MRPGIGLLILLVALASLALGLLWLVGAIGGGEWDVRLGGTIIDGALAGLILIAVGAIGAIVSLRLILTPKRSLD